MAKTTDIMEAQKTLEFTIAQKMEDFEARLTNISPRTASAESLSKDFLNFRTFVHGMLHLFRQQISEVSDQVDNIEMRHRKKYLLLSGVPEKTDENVPNLVIEAINRYLGLTITLSDIILAHRLGATSNSRPRPILFRLGDSKLKMTIWRKKTAFKGSSFVVSEFLTKQRQSLFVEARKAFSMRNVWTSDGVVKVKLPDGSIRKVKNKDELSKITLLYSKPSEDVPSEPPIAKPVPVPASSQSKSEQVLRSKRLIKK